MAKKLTFKIGEACRELDIQPYVLRYWETEFPFLKPEKANAGQRVYDARELQVIRRIKELLYDEGYTIAGAKKKLEAEIQQGGPRRIELVEAEPSVDGAGGDGPGEDGGELVAVARGDGDEQATSARSSPAVSKRAAAAAAEAAALTQLSLGEAPAVVLDSPSAERVQTLVRGLRDLREEVQEILEILRRNP